MNTVSTVLVWWNEKPAVPYIVLIGVTSSEFPQLLTGDWFGVSKSLA